MKKLIALALALVCVLGLAGCKEPKGGILDDGADIGVDAEHPGRETNKVDDTQKVPADFSFALTWGCYGISSYDSTTGKLVKTTHATVPEDYITYYTLTEAEMRSIYQVIMALNADSYPDQYDPQQGRLASDPPMTLILTVRIDEAEKTIKAENIAITDESEDARGQAFLTACKTIRDVLIASEEWKALPDYEFYYD